MVKEKRRSGRLLLTIPLWVEGKNAEGRALQSDAQALVLNRHGGRIRVSQRLDADQTVRLTNAMSRWSSEFRVVGPLSPFSDQGGEYGVEYLHPGQDIWAFSFHRYGTGKSRNPKTCWHPRSAGT